VSLLRGERLSRESAESADAAEANNPTALSAMMPITVLLLILLRISAPYDCSRLFTAGSLSTYSRFSPELVGRNVSWGVLVPWFSREEVGKSWDGAALCSVQRAARRLPES
jgi:hypothetical protein